MDTAFIDFMMARGLSPDSVKLTSLFNAFIEFFERTRVEQCLAVEDEDYLDCEIYERTIYFRRTIHVPMELMYDEDGDWIEGNRGYREKWGMCVSPVSSNEPFTNPPNIFNAAYCNFNSEHPDTASFAQAVHNHPLMRWAATQPSLAVNVMMEQVG